jgi:hypothetical protein
LETHDGAIEEVVEAIRELMIPESGPRKKIGFQLPSGKPGSPVQKRRLHLLN